MNLEEFCRALAMHAAILRGADGDLANEVAEMYLQLIRAFADQASTGETQ